MHNQQDIDFILGVNGAEPSAETAATMNALAATGNMPDSPEHPFSPFIKEDLERAIATFEELKAHAETMRNDGAGHDDVVHSIISEATTIVIETNEPDLVKHALLLFMTHDDSGRTVKIPSLMRRSYSAEAGAVGIGIEGAPHLGGKTTSPDEDKINWFREDILANEHHEHWHAVYFRGSGRQRHGELFFYMHQQMLARYDSERLAENIGRVIPFDNYNDNIEVGYDSSNIIIGGRIYPGRPAGLSWNSGAIAPMENLRSQHDALVTNSGLSGKEGNDFLGNQLEYGIHGSGHMLTAQILGGVPGVMANTATAIRDPIFWRWHKHVDTFNIRYQTIQPPYDFSDAPIGVAFDGASPTREESILIHSNSSESDTDTLFTELRTSVFRFTNGQAYNYDHLWHEPFNYTFSLNGASSAPSRVTLRVFICPRTPGVPIDQDLQLNDRALWIEMDKFIQDVQPGIQQVTRSDTESSVIRRPAELPTDIQDATQHAGDVHNVNCDCGWPYHMLLPRGTSDGMKFALFVMATDWNQDRVQQQSSCGSMSFCGAAGDEYPDERAMGYPFDRPFDGGSLVDIVRQNSNMAIRDFTIKTRSSTETAP